MDETTNPPEQSLKFEWNPAKDTANSKKHGISFNEAATVFDDLYAAFQTDELHSNDELREWVIGYSNRNRLVLVSFSERKPNHIRIISARKPTAQEHKIYEEATK